MRSRFEYYPHFADGKNLRDFKADTWLGQSSHSPLPTHLPLSRSCLILFHPALCLLSPFSKLILTISSSANLEQAAPVLGLEGQQLEQEAPRFSSSRARARGVEVALGGFWELANPVSTFPVSLLSIPAINSKYDLAPSPTMSMFLAFNAGLKNQRLEAQPLGVQQRLPERFTYFQ